MTVEDIARAIARAEGFYVGGSLPERANNPGNLKMGDVGLGTIDGKTIYPTLAAGWSALYRQINLMLTGASRYYRPEMTIQQIAAIYTGGDNALAWAGNVARSLGVTIETRFMDLMNAAGPGGGETVGLVIVGALLFLLLVN